MNRYWALVAGLMLLAATAEGQSISISFSAKDAVTDVAVQMDSVRILNLVTMRDTVISGQFTVDVDISTGVDEYFPGNIHSLDISGNFANPFKDVTSFTVMTGTRRQVQLELFSIAGRREAAFCEELEAGAHQFTLRSSSLPAGVYVLVARDGQSSRSVRIVKSGPAGGGSPAFSRTGQIRSSNAAWFSKPRAASFRFTCYEDTYHPESTETTPTQDTTIVFSMRRLPIAPGIDRFVCRNPVSFLGDTAVFEVAASSALECLTRVVIDFESDGIMDDSASASGANALATFRHAYAAAGRYIARTCVEDLYGNTSCKDLDSAVTVFDPLPVLTTSPVTEVTPTTAKSGGNITSDGGYPVTARGVCWSRSPGPTIVDGKTSDGAGMGSYTSAIIGLMEKTTYYLRAYATNSATTGYGNEVSFTTADPSAYPPVLTTTSVTEIALTTARSGGNITSDGGYPVTARGVCWSRSPGPTIVDGKTSDGAGMGSYTSAITGLMEKTTYYLRAYATNSATTGYGNEISFTTADSSAFVPVLTTKPVTEIAPTTAKSGGDISSNGGYPVTARGVCWSTSQDPVTSDSSTNDGTGTGSFASVMSGLSTDTTYYVRAYAVNSMGIGYGNEVSFTTPQDVESVTIGTQVWMLKNLDVAQYRNGDFIPQITDSAQWVNMTTGAWCYFNNDQAMGMIYGKLYNWYAVNDPRGLAPTGWHVPADSEWVALSIYLGSTMVAGGKMKETGTAHWLSPNTGADNSSGFTALPGGVRGRFGFYGLCYDGYWWSSTSWEFDAGRAWYFNLSRDEIGADRSQTSKFFGYSVRCVKD